MRLFSSMVEAVKEVERDLWEMGIRKFNKSVQDQIGEFENKELIGYSFSVTNGNDWPDTFKALGFTDFNECIQYVTEEYRERTNGEGRNPGNSWKKRPEIWKKFLHNSKFAYTYAERIKNFEEGTQLDDIEVIHARDEFSRQMIVQIYNQEWDGHHRLGIRRVPCTMYYQYLVDNANQELVLIHNMRSCDLYTHFPIDLSISWLMVQKKAEEWKLNPRLILQVGSLHAFRNDMEKRQIF